MSIPHPSGNYRKIFNIRPFSAARSIGLWLLICGLSLSGALVCRAQTSADVIVYGSTPGGFCAAIGAAREGASVILLEPTTHVGGMNTGGLSFSDSDQMYREQLMGLFHEWHLRIQKDYEKRGVTLPYDVNVKNQATWSYEALVAQRVTDAMLAEAGVKVLTERYLQSVTKNGRRITGIVTSNGTFTGRVFIDGSYEGDLMAAAGVSWRIDRESRAEYGESYAGRQYPKARMDINGFDDQGKPLPLITAVGKGPDEIGDDELMVYSYRIPMTKDPANKVAMPAPKNYDPARFELVRRFVKRHGEGKVNFSYLPVPNNKIDANNAIGSQFSIGLIGGAKDWAGADKAGRDAILEAHKQYTLEFIHFMKTDPVFSQKRRDDIAGWGLCADEFAAYGHFPPQLYVRASRRMKGMYVITQSDILDNITKPDPIMVASFPLDSHDCRRVAIKGGGVINEGTIFPVRQMPLRIGYPHHVPYRAILPQPAECDNLLVPVALSCTHVAMSSLRIEATWMLIGQSAGIAAALAADKDVAVQDLPYATLKPRLEAQGQVLTLPAGFGAAKAPTSSEASLKPSPKAPAAVQATKLPPPPAPAPVQTPAPAPAPAPAPEPAPAPAPAPVQTSSTLTTPALPAEPQPAKASASVEASLEAPGQGPSLRNPKLRSMTGLKPRLEPQDLPLAGKSQSSGTFPVGEARQSLDGVWRFTTDSPNPSAAWVDMTVPGNWDSTPQFSTYVGVGWYRRTFTPDPALKGKSVRLHFGAVYHEAKVFLNGVSIGSHVGGYTPFEFDVSDKLLFGQPNEITVSADNTYKRGAWWPWGGISRSVTLIGNNPVRLVFQHIHGDPDLAAGTASVSVKYRLQNTGATPANITIRSRLASWNKELIKATHTVKAGETKDVTAKFDLPAEQVRLWHFDHPEFYHLETTLSVSGRVQHAVSDRFGIRKIEISATEFRLNGEPVRLVGFNRIADDAGKYGNTEPDALVNADVDLMKRAGANMQRINCVPQATNLLNRMDEKGMMIVVGIPVWGNDPQSTVVDNPLTKQWLREMIERDYNHPSIIGWEVANESYQYLGYHENMMDYVRKELDPHRLVTFASWNSYRTDIAGTAKQPIDKADLPMINMYRTFTEKLATQTARWPDKPFFLSECGIRQLAGGVNADFDPAFIPGWESFARGQFPNLLGASLWCFNDYRSNFRNTPPTGFRSWGVVDENRTLKPAYHTIRKLHSPVEVLKVDGVTATVKTRLLGHIPSYTLKGYKLVWAKDELSGEIPLPTLKPGDPAWTVDLPVSGATLKLVTPLGYDIDDTIHRPSPASASASASASSSAAAAGIVLDDPSAKFAGSWARSKRLRGFIGSGYRSIGTPKQASDGSATATFRFTAPKAGHYRLDMAYSPDPTRATNVPVTVTSGASTTNFSVNQQTALNNGSYREIGTVNLVDKQETVITIGTAGTSGFVIVDAIRFVPVSKPRVRISGVYPHLAVTSEHPEVGIGAVAPWADRLWAVTYGPHFPKGDSSNKLYEIDGQLNRVIRPESLGGTPANRFIHEPSKQLIIGPHFIDASRKVRNLPYTAAPGRYTATAAHLTDPDRIYMFTMEDGLYDVNVKDLSFITRYPDVQPRGDKFLFGYHGKGAFTGQGHLIAANNGRPLSQDTPLEPSGSLARWDGTTFAKNGNRYLPLPAINSNTRYEYNDDPVAGQPEFMAGWTQDFTVQHCEVTGPGGIRGNPNPATDPVWATGFDAKSVLVRVLESGTWSTWRLPKASFTHDGSHGWHTEWPRIRQLDPETPGSPYLMHMHGLFYNFPATFSSSDFSGLKPLCSYYKMPVDYCMFNGQLVIAKNDLSKFGNRLAPRAQSNFWFGQLEDLADWGAPQGHGGVWMKDRLAAGERSDPFLVNGFTRITLHLRSNGDAAVPVRVESSNGSKTWTPVTTIKVPAGGYVYEIFNDLPAEWLRLTADAAASDLTAYFTLSNPYPHKEDAVVDTDRFAALAGIRDTTGLSDGMIRPMSGPDLQLEFASDNGYHQIGEALALQDIRNANAESTFRSQAALKKDFGGDAASVWVTEGDRRLRLPRLDPLYDAPFLSGWARGFREVVTERELLNCHGTFYEVPRENSGGRYRMQPLATHGKRITDFASWRGLLVLTGVRDDAPAGDSLVRSPSGAALWLGEVDDIWQMGEPRGTGGPWKDTAVTASTPSDPYLMAGYDRKELTLTTSAAATITVEVDFLADNTWSTYQTFSLAAGETLKHKFPKGFQAHWVRVKSDTSTTATAQFTYGPVD